MDRERAQQEQGKSTARARQKHMFPASPECPTPPQTLLRSPTTPLHGFFQRGARVSGLRKPLPGVSAAASKGLPHSPLRPAMAWGCRDGSNMGHNLRCGQHWHGAAASRMGCLCYQQQKGRSSPCDAAGAHRGFAVKESSPRSLQNCRNTVLMMPIFSFSMACPWPCRSL